jgi:uncharacterized repeat protein (TIGR03803 family)
MTGELTTMAEFNGIGGINNGALPKAVLVSDGAGFLWGTTSAGGADDKGTVFKVDVTTGAITTVVELTGNGSTNKGYSPQAGLISDGAGSFLGTTAFGGASVFVHSSTGTGLAFAASAKGSQGSDINNSNNDAIWWTSSLSAPLEILAREGDEPSGAPTGAKWKSFTSLAYPGGDGGPIFTARLKPGPPSGPDRITAKDDVGLYAKDGFGVLQQLLRENQSVAGKTVKTFSVLKAVSGSAGVSRSFNAVSQVATLVTFTDGTTGIIKIDIP